MAFSPCAFCAFPAPGILALLAPPCPGEAPCQATPRPILGPRGGKRVGALTGGCLPPGKILCIRLKSRGTVASLGPPQQTNHLVSWPRGDPQALQTQLPCHVKSGFVPQAGRGAAERPLPLRPRGSWGSLILRRARSLTRGWPPGEGSLTRAPSSSRLISGQGGGGGGGVLAKGLFLGSAKPSSPASDLY